MATTGELRAIIQELELIDIGEAASYLGEETLMVEVVPVSAQPILVTVTSTVHLVPCTDPFCDCATFS